MGRGADNAAGLELLFGSRRRERNHARRRQRYHVYPKEDAFRPALWALGTDSYFLASDENNESGFSGCKFWFAKAEMPKAFYGFKACKHIPDAAGTVAALVKEIETSAAGKPPLRFSESFERLPGDSGLTARVVEKKGRQRFRLIGSGERWSREYAVNSTYLEAVHRVLGTRTGAWREARIGDQPILAFFSPDEELTGALFPVRSGNALEHGAREAGVLRPGE